MNERVFRQNKYADYLVKIISVIIMILAFVLAGTRQIKAYEEIVVVIDPGHGGVVLPDNSNGGCMYNNLCEKDVNLITATALYNELSQYQNVSVYMTRNADIELSIDQRIAFAKSVNADVVISVHYNASEDHIFYGSEIFTSMYGKQRATGYGLATCIEKQWKNYGSASKGIKTRKGKNGDYYGLIRQGRDEGIPVIILEHGYLDNDNDYNRMSSAGDWQQLGQMDAAGIAEYYGLKKDTVKAEIKPTVNVVVEGNPVLPDETAPSSVKLTVDEYDEETGEISYSLSASEDEDDLMYYGIMKGPITDETVFTDLILWDNSKGVQTGEFKVPAEYKGNLTARVYNTYELYTDSEPVDMSMVNKKNSEAGDAPDEKSDTKNGDSDDLSEQSDAENSEKDSSKLEVLDTIILGESEASDPIEITPEMVDEAESAISNEAKAKFGLVVAISLVGLALVIGVAVGIYKMITDAKKNNRYGSGKSYDWEDRDDY